MKNHTIALLGSLWLGILTNGFGQGAILVQHSGSVNPVNEGFALTVSGTGTTIVGPVTNDFGMNAWSVGGNNFIDYSQSLTPIPHEDWILSVNMRIIQSGGGGLIPNNWVDIIDGSEQFELGFGTDSNGNAAVWIETALNGIGSPIFTLNGRGSVYNNYQLDYNAIANTASLWVNGTEEVNDINGQPGDFYGVSWGTGQSGPSQANWNLVSLETVPEPTTSWLILLGSGVLFYVRRKWAGK
jgi:hypothetical protein